MSARGFTKRQGLTPKQREGTPGLSGCMEGTKVKVGVKPQREFRRQEGRRGELEEEVELVRA